VASFQKKGNAYFCQFYWLGKRHTFALGDVTEDEADRRARNVGHRINLLKQGDLTLPPGMDIVTFVKTGGATPVAPPPLAVRGATTLGKLRDAYLEAHSIDALEETTLGGIRTHFRHLVKTYGEAYPVTSLTLADLQKHVDRRSRAKGLRASRLSPATIRKELVSLRTVWNWGAGRDLVSGTFPPLKRLTFPKGDEKPPFMTREEIERKLAVGGLTAKETDELWDSLYLRESDIAELLTYVREHAAHPWVFPLFATAAHTGMRRSELIRLKVTDLDAGGGELVIHERKRVHGKRTTRRAPVTPFLNKVLDDWLRVHPGGPYLFCHAGVVARSKKRSRTTGHKGEKERATTTAGRLAGVRERATRPVSGSLTRDEVHDHFKRTLQASERWRVLRGLHALRHSYISCLAAAGVEQRIIGDIVGHQTEEQRRRYRHLFPEVKRKAVMGVFGD
jgi:integrase